MNVKGQEFKDMAFRFIGHTTDSGRMSIIRQLGENCLNHAIFTHYLTEMGHAHDWICYRQLMESRGY